MITYGYELHRCLEAAAATPGGRGRLRRGRRRPHDRAARRRDDPARRSARRRRPWWSTRTTARSAPGPRSPSTIAEEAMFDLDAPIVRIGGPDIPAMPFAGAARALLHRTRARSHLPADAGSGPFLASRSIAFRGPRNPSITPLDRGEAAEGSVGATSEARGRESRPDLDLGRSARRLLHRRGLRRVRPAPRLARATLARSSPTTSSPSS